jgi:DNA replication protein DnaC
MDKKRPRGGDWTKLGDIPWIKAPQTPPPAELYWECEECGLVEPYANPLGLWQRRSCACQRRAKREMEEVQRQIARLDSQRTYTFGGWLGKHWVDAAAVQQMSSCRFENYDASRFPVAYEKALEFALKPVGNLIFHGWYGVGKTHLEAAIANYLRELPNHPKICLFASAPQFFMAYDNARHYEGRDDHYTLLRRATTAEVLIIDDVDKYRHTDAREDLYFTIIDERCKSHKPTILSINNLDKLPHHIGEAACSRLSRGLLTIKMVGGTDYRQEQI